MDNQFLDFLLKDIAKRKGVYNEDLQSMDYAEADVFRFKDSIQYLTENSYIINRPVGSQTHFQISPKGQKLILDGGFVGEANYKNDILKYSKDSRGFARRAYYVAIAGIIVSILLFIISRL